MKIQLPIFGNKILSKYKTSNDYDCLPYPNSQDRVICCKLYILHIADIYAEKEYRYLNLTNFVANILLQEI